MVSQTVNGSGFIAQQSSLLPNSMNNDRNALVVFIEGGRGAPKEAPVFTRCGIAKPPFGPEPFG